MQKPEPPKLPDPWLFDTEALLRELDRCRETALQIAITNPNATHFGIQLTVSAIWNLTENIRYLLHLHREQQRAIRRRQEQSLSTALAGQRPTQRPKTNVVPITATEPTHAGKRPAAQPTRRVRNPRVA